jgi:hypothetical protein
VESGTLRGGVIEWYAGNDDAYLLTQLEDLMLIRVLMSSGKAIPQLEVVFINAAQAAPGSKNSSAACILCNFQSQRNTTLFAPFEDPRAATR